jgi:uncharacterized membrane protein YebE (DUF533 family)
MNFGDLIGGFLQNAMTSSGNDRIGRTMDDLQRTKFDIPFAGGASAGSSGAGDLFSSLRDVVQGGLSGAASSPAKAGGIGAVLGSLLGGGGDSMRGALGGGALAMLASVAMKAFMNSGQGTPQVGGDAGPWSGGNAPLGLKVPETRDEEQELQKTAELVLKGMINAAKSDGQVSREEAERIIGKMRGSGLDDDAQRWLLSEMQKPLDVNAFAAEIPNREVAAQVYAASLLAVEVDTAAERQYLEQLAQRTGLHPAVVRHIQETMGAAA